MTPEFANGDLVVVDPHAVWENGTYVIALKDNETIFKQYKVHGKTAVLKPLNPKYDDIVVTEEIQIIGRVIRKIKRYQGAIVIGGFGGQEELPAVSLCSHQDCRESDQMS